MMSRFNDGTHPCEARVYGARERSSYRALWTAPRFKRARARSPRGHNFRSPEEAIARSDAALSAVRHGRRADDPQKRRH